MTCKDSHFLIGLGIGSIFGALAYGFARSARAKKMKAEVFAYYKKAVFLLNFNALILHNRPES